MATTTTRKNAHGHGSYWVSHSNEDGDSISLRCIARSTTATSCIEEGDVVVVVSIYATSVPQFSWPSLLAHPVVALARRLNGS